MEIFVFIENVSVISYLIRVDQRISIVEDMPFVIELDCEKVMHLVILDIKVNSILV